jgi:hypothetical protein
MTNDLKNVIVVCGKRGMGLNTRSLAQGDWNTLQYGLYSYGNSACPHGHSDIMQDT